VLLKCLRGLGHWHERLFQPITQLGRLCQGNLQLQRLAGVDLFEQVHGLGLETGIALAHGQLLENGLDAVNVVVIRGLDHFAQMSESHLLGSELTARVKSDKPTLGPANPTAVVTRLFNGSVLLHSHHHRSSEGLLDMVHDHGHGQVLAVVAQPDSRDQHHPEHHDHRHLNIRYHYYSSFFAKKIAFLPKNYNKKTL